EAVSYQHVAFIPRSALRSNGKNGSHGNYGTDGPWLTCAGFRHSAFRTPHSALRTPHSALRTPHSALRTPHSALRTPHSSDSRMSEPAVVAGGLGEGIGELPFGTRDALDDQLRDARAALDRERRAADVAKDNRHLAAVIRV